MLEYKRFEEDEVVVRSGKPEEVVVAVVMALLC